MLADKHADTLMAVLCPPARGDVIKR